MYFCFGEFDGVGLVDFPSNVDAVAALLAISSSGAFTKLQTTLLISMDESVAAMAMAHNVVGSFVAPAD